MNLFNGAIFEALDYLVDLFFQEMEECFFQDLKPAISSNQKEKKGYRISEPICTSSQSVFKTTLKSGKLDQKTF